MSVLVHYGLSMKTQVPERIFSFVKFIRWFPFFAMVISEKMFALLIRKKRIISYMLRHRGRLYQTHEGRSWNFLEQTSYVQIILRYTNPSKISITIAVSLIILFICNVCRRNLTKATFFIKNKKQKYLTTLIAEERILPFFCPRTNFI